MSREQVGLSVAGARCNSRPTLRPKTKIKTFFRVFSWSISFGDSPLPDQEIKFDDQDLTSIISWCCQDQDSNINTQVALLHVCDQDQYCDILLWWESHKLVLPNVPERGEIFSHFFYLLTLVLVVNNFGTTKTTPMQ